MDHTLIQQQSLILHKKLLKMFQDYNALLKQWNETESTIKTQLSTLENFLPRFDEVCSLATPHPALQENPGNTTTSIQFTIKSQKTKSILSEFQQNPSFICPGQSEIEKFGVLAFFPNYLPKLQAKAVSQLSDILHNVAILIENLMGTTESMRSMVLSAHKHVEEADQITIEELTTYSPAPLHPNSKLIRTYEPTISECLGLFESIARVFSIETTRKTTLFSQLMDGVENLSLPFPMLFPTLNVRSFDSIERDMPSVQIQPNEIYRFSFAGFPDSHRQETNDQTQDQESNSATEEFDQTLIAPSLPNEEKQIYSQMITSSLHRLGKDWVNPHFGQTIDRIRTILNNVIGVNASPGNLADTDNLDSGVPNTINRSKKK